MGTPVTLFPAFYYYPPSQDALPPNRLPFSSATQSQSDRDLALRPSNRRLIVVPSLLERLADSAVAALAKMDQPEKPQKRVAKVLLPDPRVTSLLPYFCTPQLDKDSPGQAEAMRTELLQLIDEIFSTPSPLVNYLESKNLNYRLRHAIVKDPLRLHLLLRCCYDHSLVCLTAAAATTTPERWGPPSLEGKAQLCLEWLKRNADFITTLSLTKGEQIYCIPEEIFELPNLTSLCIVFQRVRTLSPSLGSARKLTSLVLSYNRIATLPGAIEGLAALQELRLNGNLFFSVPTQGLPPNLAFLDLSENPLETIPMTLGRMTRQHFPGRIVYT